MNAATVQTHTPQLSKVAERARQLYAACVTGAPDAPAWWTAVVITASSARQADRYSAEIQRRRENGKIPESARYLVVPDPGGARVGSGGATLHALRELAQQAFFAGGRSSSPSPVTLGEWWTQQRVLLAHCGGDSRRLPQYSLSGKLFSAVPVETPWGEPSTVFDEMLALSTAWVEQIPAGVLAGSGDVILTFDASTIDWERPGVIGVGLLQPPEVATGHGVYVADERGRVYAFLQKPSVAEMAAAGGIRDGGCVAVDSGLLRFDPSASALLMKLAGVEESGEGLRLGPHPLEAGAPEIDLYQHFTRLLTGEWRPEKGDAPVLYALAAALKGIPLWCAVVPGAFTHIGTTSLFRQLMTEETDFSRLQAAQRRLGVSRQPGVISGGVVADSVFTAGADLKAGTVAVECHVDGPVRAAAGAVLHGLDSIAGSIEIPEDAVAHQLPVSLADGTKGVVIRVYGVADDPKAGSARATWFGRPLLEQLAQLGLDPERVWPGIAAGQRTLWNAELFPVGPIAEAWACAQWMMRLPASYSLERWETARKLSLAGSAEWADAGALEAARSRRLKAHWRSTALALVEAGADVRPLLANSPGVRPLAETGEALLKKAAGAEATSPTDAASLYYNASLFLAQAGLAPRSSEARETAFRMVERAVAEGAPASGDAVEGPWRRDSVTVEAPARIDLGGGWSDSPPFCLDWGGVVLNCAVLLDGRYPIQAMVKRLNEPVVRWTSDAGSTLAEYRTCEQILKPATPGDETSIARTALSMTGLFHANEPLEGVLARMNGGLEIRTDVQLPMGSGLGTSSILAACVVRALGEMTGAPSDAQTLSDRVMRLEQLMTTGGGWQDQAGGIFPGVKLILSGPGLRQKIRVQPVGWTAERQRDFESHIVLYYTGLRRVARDLLRQVVGRYLARETATVQVLHSIKTLALEMSHAMQEGDWRHLGSMLDRHWELNQTLDPHTTNAPINALLEAVRPHIYGAKLAGAGGGGFMILLARSVEAAANLRRFLGEWQKERGGGSVHDLVIAQEGLRVSNSRSN